MRISAFSGKPDEYVLKRGPEGVTTDHTWGKKWGRRKHPEKHPNGGHEKEKPTDVRGPRDRGKQPSLTECIHGQGRRC